MKRLLAFPLVALLAAPLPTSACDDPAICETPPIQRYPSLARTIGITVERDWITENIEELHESFGRGCQAFGECLSQWGNPVEFCRLLLTRDLRSECEKRFDVSTDRRAWQQCRAVADVYSLAQNPTRSRVWQELQACAAREAGEAGVPSPRIELVPANPDPGESIELEIQAYHPETGVPMYGFVTVDGTMRGATFQPFRYALSFVRDRDEYGCVSMRSPEIVVSANPARGSGAPAFAPATAVFETPVPSTELELDPQPSEWSAGANVVRVIARDVATGEVLDGKIFGPGGVRGEASDPVTIELRGNGTPCGEPLWFRPREANRPDAKLPVPSCR